MNNQAVEPNFNIQKFISEFKLADKKDKDTFTDRDKAFYRIAQQDDWQELKGYIDKRVKALRQTLSDTGGLGFAEIGARFLVVDLATDELEKIISKVENARKIIEQEEDKTSK